MKRNYGHRHLCEREYSPQWWKQLLRLRFYAGHSFPQSLHSLFFSIATSKIGFNGHIDIPARPTNRITSNDIGQVVAAYKKAAEADEKHDKQSYIITNTFPEAGSYRR